MKDGDAYVVLVALTISLVVWAIVSHFAAHPSKYQWVLNGEPVVLDCTVMDGSHMECVINNRDPTSKGGAK